MVHAPVRSVPAGTIPPGTPMPDQKNLPAVFTPITIRGLELQNRFVVSPMGTWSASNGHLTDFHLAHLGAFAIRGAALIVIESTAVMANGRTSPQDAGLWMDSQIHPLQKVVEFIHTHGQKAGIQLNHAGRKASMLAPRLAPGGKVTVASEQDGGWPEDVWAPSAIPYTDAHLIPQMLSVKQISTLVESFGTAARRAVLAGVDFVELHAAHGYLIHQFLSPLTNQRTDDYGGSFDNRFRFLRDIIEAVRKELPASVPLSVRISATEWMDWSELPSWDFDQSVMLAKLLPKLGVDVLDISSAGNHQEQRIPVHPRYQIDLAARMTEVVRKNNLPLLIACVGFVNSPDVARRVIQGDDDENTGNGLQTSGAVADLAFIGRQFLREPGFVLRSAKELGVKVHWPFLYQIAEPKENTGGSDRF